MADQTRDTECDLLPMDQEEEEKETLIQMLSQEQLGLLLQAPGAPKKIHPASRRVPATPPPEDLRAEWDIPHVEKLICAFDYDVGELRIFRVIKDGEDPPTTDPHVVIFSQTEWENLNTVILPVMKRTDVQDSDVDGAAFHYRNTNVGQEQERTTVMRWDVSGDVDKRVLYVVQRPKCYCSGLEIPYVIWMRIIEEKGAHFSTLFKESRARRELRGLKKIKV